ncbi:MAG: flagellar biosynthesis protein FliQ [Gammaproteobacteria bacterium]|nr:flagellar biosynthesis protein FliQ [Gammaproteobacteria bacterium]
MTPETVVSIFQKSLEVTLLLCLVVLVPALIVGLIVSMLQAATQINEMTLSFIPKLIITVLTLMFAGPWLLRVLTEFTQTLLHDIPYIVG